MLNQSKEAARHVEAVLSALDILDCFQTHPGLTLKAIIDMTGLTRSRVMRLIGTLEARGYVVGNPDTRTYHPGIKLSILAKTFERNNRVEVMIRPVLKQLSAHTGESATFYVCDGLERVALAREEGRHAIRYTIAEGQRYALNRGGAASKVLLAFSPSELSAAVFDDPATDTRTLKREIAKTRKQGYAVSQAENTPGASSLATPVFGADGNLAGAMTLSGPSIRMTAEQVEKWIDLIVETAGYLSNRLGASSLAKE